MKENALLYYICFLGFGLVTTFFDSIDRGVEILPMCLKVEIMLKLTYKSNGIGTIWTGDLGWIDDF